jgi:ATP-dependent Clp protease protease subunit
MKDLLLTALLITPLCGTLHAQEDAPRAKSTEPETSAAADNTSDQTATVDAEGSEDATDDSEETAQEKEQKKLATENALQAEQLKKDLADMRARVAKLKLEKELLTEELAIAELKRNRATLEDDAAHANKLRELTHAAEVAKAKATRATSELKIKEAEWGEQSARLEAEINTLETEKKRQAYANSKPAYLENPLKEDGSLVISDRRVSLNGPITMTTADHVTTRINYFNNKDGKLPIFIVIDTSPGGSVMAGYRILKAMEGSSAPVYVVVKSFAASMAASICTLAEKSFAYPNAVFLHHQISTTYFLTSLNLTEQKEAYEESQKWWKRLASPIAKKMGITTEELIKKMYAESSSGDWTEFGTEAQKLKWVDHIVERIHETSLLVDPDVKQPASSAAYHGLSETTDAKGKPCMYLPRLTPKDCYFLYNKDGYYRVR